MIFANRSLAFKQSVYIGILLTVLFVIFSLLIGAFWLRSLNRQLSDNGLQVARTTASRINDILIRAQSTGEMLRLTLNSGNMTTSEIDALTAATLRSLQHAAPEILAINIAYEPEEAMPGVRHYSMLTFMRDNKVRQKQIGGEKLQYFFRDWYLVPKSLNRPLWTSPFYSEGGLECLLFSYTVPFYRPDGTFRGAVVVDMDLRKFRALLTGSDLSGAGYSFLLSQFGQIIIHPNQKMEFNNSIFSLISLCDAPEEREAGREILRSKEGRHSFKKWTLFNGGTLIFHAGCINDWKVCVAIPQYWAFWRIARILAFGLLIWAGFLAVVCCGVMLIMRRSLRPLAMLAAAAGEIGRGKFNRRLPENNSNDELGTLSKSFAAMQQQLARYIGELKLNIAARERMEGELNAARTIQNDILPKLLPPLPDNPDFSISPELIPARGIGGDLYDVSLRTDDELVIVIGDVSGKGIPAALFMAISQTLQRGISRNVARSPGEILTKLNELLSSNNNSMMFLTCFLGVLKLSTGVLSYCNAGHNPPLLLRDDGRMEQLNTLHGPPLGVVPGSYGTAELLLGHGDLLLLYTDGITEAFNPQGEMFGEKKLSELLQSMHGRNLTPDQIRRMVLDAVNKFADGCEQSDDITMLLMRFNRQI